MKRAENLLSAALLCAAAVVMLTPSDAQAQAAGTCQTDFQKMMEPRQALINRINGFRKKRPTADQACSTLGQLVSADARLIKWMTDNKDWCQIPDELINQLQTSSGQASQSRGQACGAAKNQKAQLNRLRAQQRSQQAGGGGAPPVGSGVRLPQGAL